MQAPDVIGALRGQEIGAMSAIGIDQSLLTGKLAECPNCEKRKFRLMECTRTQSKEPRVVCAKCWPETISWREFACLHLGITHATLREMLMSLAPQHLLTKTQVRNKMSKTNADANAALAAQCQPIKDGTIATEYLRSREIDPAPYIDHPEILYHPGLAYWHENTDYGQAPALICKVWNIQPKAFSTLHRTWISAEGKAQFKDADGNPLTSRKQMPGNVELNGGVIWLSYPGKVDTLVIGEGLENVMHYEQANLMERRHCACSALNAGNLVKFVPPENIKNMVIIGDNDESFTGQAAAFALARRMTSRHVKVKLVIPGIHIDNDYTGCDLEDWLRPINKEAAA